MIDAMPYRTLQRDELLALAAQPWQGDEVSLNCFHDEHPPRVDLFDASKELPHCNCGWSLGAVALFFQWFDAPVRPNPTPGTDELRVGFITNDSRKSFALSDSVSVTPQHLPQSVMGRLCVVVEHGKDTPTLVHVSHLGTLGVSLRKFRPTSQNRDTHPRTADGWRIDEIWFDGLPPFLLRWLAQREQLSDADTPREIVRVPLAIASFLPNIATKGETKRRRRIGRPNSIPFSVISADLCAQRVPVAVTVKLDDESMRLASNSYLPRRTAHRQAGLQLRMLYPSSAKSDAEVQEAVQQQLRHFDTDYLLSFDAITSLLANVRDEASGIALDDTLRRKVVTMRFGSTHNASTPQLERVRNHFDTLMQVRVEVVPQGSTKTFRGPILLKTGELVDASNRAVEPLKIGDRVMLNPELYRELRKGKGMFVDAKYFQLDPYRQDWHLRLYRYLAARWSANSPKLAAEDWTLRVKLQTALDMAGIDWQTKAVGRDRGAPQARRNLDDTLEALRADGLVGAWRIEGKGMSDDATIIVEVPKAVRTRIANSRPGLHADAASGALAARSKAALDAKAKRPRKA